MCENVKIESENYKLESQQIRSQLPRTENFRLTRYDSKDFIICNQGKSRCHRSAFDDDIDKPFRHNDYVDDLFAVRVFADLFISKRQFLQNLVRGLRRSHHS